MSVRCHGVGRAKRAARLATTIVNNKERLAAYAARKSRPRAPRSGTASRGHLDLADTRRA